MSQPYDPAEIIAAENWPLWKNALTLVVVLAAVVLIFVVTGQPVDIGRTESERAIAYCERELDSLRAAPGLTPGEVELLQAACQSMRDKHLAAWGREP